MRRASPVTANVVAVVFVCLFVVIVVVVVVVVVVVWFTQMFPRLAQVACFSTLGTGCRSCFDLAYCVVCVCCDQLAPVQTCACPDTWCPSKNLGTGTNLNKFKFRQCSLHSYIFTSC